ncbi:hypothetical protein Agabi119p4_9696 [Agaricus bisporus var. burnettii]|uniref:F-box domain-containing protein n=1 Tax=Agaricus bisporus var. burnettii TaxID=192524 RepID=A0A8H7C528_AGABI|nr:hypothetical protein Agabi119p4_9696 [Agaricus bisporus var. burnettii]
MEESELEWTAKRAAAVERETTTVRSFHAADSQSQQNFCRVVGSLAIKQDHFKFKMTITANECPRCGYHPETEVKEGDSALEAEVRRLEDLIPRLQEEKASLLRRINNTQEKTRCLPFEVLSNIFQFARPPINFTAHKPIRYGTEDPDSPPLTGHFDPAEYFHHTLAAVSHRWRQVALSTPQLWTSISLRVLNTFTNFNTSLLDLYFQNAHNIPISIRLDLSNPALAWTAGSGWKRADFLTRLEPLEEIIFNRNAEKIQSLVFIQPPAEWFLSGCGNLSHCTSITVYWSSCDSIMDLEPSDLSLNFSDLPCLQHVKLVDNIPMTVPSTISALHLSEARLSECMPPLEELPNLIELEITDARRGGLPLRLHDNTTKLLVLHCLKRLKWSEIHWDESRYRLLPTFEERKALRLAFFSSLPPTLSSLTFGYVDVGFVDVDSMNVIDLLDCVPQVAKLHFTESPREVVVGAVKTIGRRPANRGASSSRSYILPNLCALLVSGTGSTIDAFIFIEMLRALYAAGPRPKRFLLTTDSDVKWRSDALREA